MAKKVSKPRLKFPIGTLVSIKNKVESTEAHNKHFNTAVEAIVIDSDVIKYDNEEEDENCLLSALLFIKVPGTVAKKTSYKPRIVEFTAEKDTEFEIKRIKNTSDPVLNRYYNWSAEYRDINSDSRGRYITMGCQKIYLRDVVGYLRLVGQHYDNVSSKTLFNPEDVFRMFKTFHV